MDKMSLFVALTGIAVLLQAGVLLAMYIAMRKSTQQLEILASDVKTKLMPTLAQAQEIITALRPKVEIIVENVAETTTTLREEVHRDLMRLLGDAHLEIPKDKRYAARPAGVAWGRINFAPQ